MTNGRTIDVPGIGPVLFRRNRRARRVVVSVSCLSGVRASVPASLSFEKAATAVLSYKEWISEHQARVKRDEAERRVLTAKLDTLGKGRAGAELTSRTRELAGQHGFTCNKISIRTQTTRWGSCSFKNNISLNVRLVCLPEELRDYVILHELVHTRVHNHSREFHAELGKYVENPKLLSRGLRKIGLKLL